MLEFILLLLLLLLVSVFSVVLGVHLQAAKSKTDCGCGVKTAVLNRRLQRLESSQGKSAKE